MKKTQNQTKEAIITIEGIELRDLSKKALNFYFKCSKIERDVLREYIKKGIQTQKAKQKIAKDNFLKELKVRFSKRYRDKRATDEIIDETATKHFGDDL